MCSSGTGSGLPRPSVKLNMTSHDNMPRAFRIHSQSGSPTPARHGEARHALVFDASRFSPISSIITNRGGAVSPARSTWLPLLGGPSILPSATAFSFHGRYLVPQHDPTRLSFTRRCFSRANVSLPTQQLFTIAQQTKHQHPHHHHQFRSPVIQTSCAYSRLSPSDCHPKSRGNMAGAGKRRNKRDAQRSRAEASARNAGLSEGGDGAADAGYVLPILPEI